MTEYLLCDDACLTACEARGNGISDAGGIGKKGRANRRVFLHFAA